MLRVTQHILICLLLKFYAMLFTLKVIQKKKLLGSVNYGPPCKFNDGTAPDVSKMDMNRLRCREDDNYTVSPTVPIFTAMQVP